MKKTIACPKCGKQIERKYYATGARKGQINGWYYCPICKKDYPTFKS